jgi:hypothetical protein
MRLLKKNTAYVFLLLGIFMAAPVYSQKETGKHKRMWWRFGLKKHRDAFNPNVEHGKSTHEQSRKQKREDAKAQKRARREYKRWQKKSKRKAGVK